MLSLYAKTENIKLFDEAMIREFLMDKSQEKGWAPQTYRLYRQNFSTFFNWCVKIRAVEKNPCENIEKPKLPSRLPRCLDKKQTIRVLHTVSSYPWITAFQRTRNEAIIYTFIYSGIRLQELLDLKTRDINLETGEMFIQQGKGKKDRVVPIHPRLRIVLRTYIQEKEKKKTKSSYFFTGLYSSKPLNAKNTRLICKKISLESGVKLTPHMLRHTFARLSLDANMNLYKLKEMLGHSDLSTTQIYLSVSKEGLKQSFNKINLV